MTIPVAVPLQNRVLGDDQVRLDKPYVDFLTQLSGGIAGLLTAPESGRARLNWYARIVTAAGTSSSLTVRVQWTDGGNVCSHTSAALTGNTTATTGQETLFLQADPGTTVTYQTTYASVGVPTMAYQLSILAEVLP